ncbi:MAG: transposase [Treponema sp.]|nr:transposase [Treponema sp.]
MASAPPKPWGNVAIDNRNVLNTLIYRCENGCKWRTLPQTFGNRHVLQLKPSSETRCAGRSV